ncbi:hypothetical protein E4U19_002143 [Claviceps sp. Clav32 group G5]|nr:hypothetical protein E4U19_002143 [Claviceps sp. Clav32 group G5]
MFCTRCIRVSAIGQRLPLLRQFHAPAPLRSSTEPILTSLEKDASKSQSKRPRSMCPEGTVLTGINYIKGGQDPVAKKDEDYPEWLWRCLEAIKKTDTVVEDDMDEFSKSKKLRTLAAKRQRAREAKLLAEGNMDALAPKIPLQEQSINLPGEEGGTPEENAEAAQKRYELKRAMRKERKAKIKENNYLKAM